MKKLVLLLLLACFFVLRAAESHAAEAPARFPLVYGAMSGNTVPLWLAKEQGLFRKYGLDPQLIFIIAGRAAQAMLSGEINIGVIGATHVTNAVTSGGDMTMLLGLETKLDYFLVTHPSIQSAEGLKGKKVAIGTPSGTASLAAYVGLDYMGLVPRRDNITLMGVGAPTDRLAALLAGGVDAISVSPEVAHVATNQGYRVLLDLAKENVPFQSAGLVTSRKFMRSNPQFVENVARADCRRRGLCAQSRKQESGVAESCEEPETRQTGHFGEELSESGRSSPQAVSRPAGSGVGAEIASSTRLESQSVAAED